MNGFIDRRLNSKNKSMVNRQRFLRRYKQQIKYSLAQSINKRRVADHQSAENINIPNKDLSEPFFHKGAGGVKQHIHPGNDKFTKGDMIRKPPQQSSANATEKSANNGQTTDDFIFSISADEYLQLLFEDLALPNLQKNQLDKLIAHKTVRSGYCNEGSVANMDIIKSMQNAIGRRIAMTSSKRKELAQCQQLLAKLNGSNVAADAHLQQLEITAVSLKIKQLQDKIAKTPFIDSFDLRFKNYSQQAIPSSKAVMFCLMDVSGSMDQSCKDIAKRFYILLYLFLTRTYKSIDVVFIIHHTQAREVDEDEFFYSQETGGTIVSSALKLMLDIIKKRYHSDDWNIYAAQASDGDNWQDDTSNCLTLLSQKILPIVRFYSYIEINASTTKYMWQQYQNLTQQHHNFAIKQVKTAADIYPVFRSFFKKQQNLQGDKRYG
ncbi:YeaH/YhbH family protein [Colwelliaceae bacterium BS250]